MQYILLLNIKWNDKKRKYAHYIVYRLTLRAGDIYCYYDLFVSFMFKYAQGYCLLCFASVLWWKENC